MRLYLVILFLVQYALATLNFFGTNEYSRRDGFLGQDYPWAKGRLLLEPHRESLFELTFAKPNSTYVWTFYDTMETMEGSSVNYTFTSVVCDFIAYNLIILIGNLQSCCDGS